ncbi:hypothetical protein [Litorivivens sp.]|uniref:hypothetical protein n=1 Tax=Litorivivens sp. TaxID=2020868 RepID=UPI0035656744
MSIDAGTQPGDYSGDYRPDFTLTDLDHATLAWYGREVMLANHIHDRAIMPQLALNHGMAAQTRAACDEWMGASPIYNYRNRALLNIGGDDIETIFKAFQLDIGAPHTFLQFHWDLQSPSEGQFWLTHCGAYNHVRRITNADPTSETQICHHMEDPTFDATVMAVNQRARCRPVFRPPHGTVPAEGPCRWRVFLGDELILTESSEVLPLVKQSRAANFAFAAIEPGNDGLADYAGPFNRAFTLEMLSHPVLARQCKEFSLDVHLLQRACYTSVMRDHGAESAWEMTAEQWRAMAPVYVHRLRNALGIRGDGMDAILKLLQTDPYLPPEYLKTGTAKISDSHGRFWIEDCEALQDEPLGVVGLLFKKPDIGISAPVAAANPQARCQLTNDCPEAKGKAVIAWDIVIDDSHTAPAPSDYTALVAGEDMWDHDASRHQYAY